MAPAARSSSSSSSSSSAKSAGKRGGGKATKASSSVKHKAAGASTGKGKPGISKSTKKRKAKDIFIGQKFVKRFPPDKALFEAKVKALEDVRGRKDKYYLCKFDDGDEEHIKPADLARLFVNKENLVGRTFLRRRVPNALGNVEPSLGTIHRKLKVQGEGTCYDVKYADGKSERLRDKQLMPLLVAHYNLPHAEYLPDTLVGATFSRRYGKIVLDARVIRTDFVEDDDETLFFVKYSDGQKEHLTFKELSPYLVEFFASKVSKAKAKKNAKLKAKAKPKGPPELPPKPLSSTYAPYIHRTLTRRFDDTQPKKSGANTNGRDTPQLDTSCSSNSSVSSSDSSDEEEDALFEGTVLRLDRMDEDDEENPGAEMYFVRYEDGDTEHLTKQELKKILDPMVYPQKPAFIPPVSSDGPAVIHGVFPKSVVEQLLTGFEKGSTPMKEGNGRNPKRTTQVFPGLLPFHNELLAHRASLPTSSSKGSSSATMTLPTRVQQSTPFIEDLVPRDVTGRVDGVIPLHGGISERLRLVDLILSALKRTPLGREAIEKCRRKTSGRSAWEPKDCIKAIHVLHTPANCPAQFLHSDSPAGAQYWTLLIPLHDPSGLKGNESSGTTFFDKGLEEWRTVHPSPGSGALFSGRVPHFGSDCEKGKLVVYAVISRSDIDVN